MKEIHQKIIADLIWLSEKTEDPIVKITYSMASTIVDLHFGELGKKWELIERKLNDSTYEVEIVKVTKI